MVPDAGFGSTKSRDLFVGQYSSGRWPAWLQSGCQTHWVCSSKALG